MGYAIWGLRFSRNEVLQIEWNLRRERGKLIVSFQGFGMFLTLFDEIDLYSIKSLAVLDLADLCKFQSCSVFGISSVVISSDTGTRPPR